ncbi:MAG: hypothetical protein ABW202_15505 [Duganella sp.]
MNNKKANESSLISQYKAEAAARRKVRINNGAASGPLAVKAKDGVFTVRFGENAKPLSALGGVTKVLGRSRIDIPEFKLRRG